MTACSEFNQTRPMAATESLDNTSLVDRDLSEIHSPGLYTEKKMSKQMQENQHAQKAPFPPRKIPGGINSDTAILSITGPRDSHQGAESVNSECHKYKE
jgi:hypothetical protein